MIRMGIGYDSHRFASGRPLILGGVAIPHPAGLIGHSDADAVAHAVIDAMLGAAALGDIGQLFPDTSPQYRDADSMVLLSATREHLRAHHWQLNQADVTVIAEAPKLAPHVAAMRARIAGVLGVAVDAVSIKAKTNETMGFVGRGEGIAVMAVATLVPIATTG